MKKGRKMSMKEYILKTEHLTKCYGNKKIINDINIEVKKGDIYGLIGRNGAGKTTIMRLITSLVKPTSGTFSLFGKKENQAKNRIGCLIEQACFFPNLTAYDNLRYYQIQKGIVEQEEIQEILKMVHLENAGKTKFKNFSLGMKQRLGIALTLLNHPDFIILDEPINGLDPIGISEIREMIQQLNQEQGITFLISSHILSELYLVATRFAFIEQGTIMKQIDKETLDLECQKCLLIKTNDVKKATVVLEKELDIKEYTVVNQSEIRVYERLKESALINQRLVENQIAVKELMETGTSLEDYFKELLKRGV